MLKMQFRTPAATANRYAMDRLADGHVIRFDIGYGDNNSLDVIVEDSNNDYGRKYPYTIRFVVKVDPKDQTLTVRPIVNKSLVRDFGIIGRDCVLTLFHGPLMRQLSRSW